MKNTILLIEDDFSIADALSFMLKSEGFNVLWASRGEDGIKLFTLNTVDLILLDVMLPDISGFDVLRRINDKGAPVIMLTARIDITDKILGLELGADDYITKPFDVREVITRIKVALRRVKSFKEEDIDEIIISEDVSIQLKAHKVEKAGSVIKLKPKEYNLLLFLAQNKDIAFERDVLLDRIWGMDFEGVDRTVDVNIGRLRSKIGDKDGKIIETVFGLGYRMNKYEKK